MDLRNEDIQVLQEMQAIQRKLQAISDDLEELDADEYLVIESIDKEQYNTGHANACLAEEKQKKQDVFDTYERKKKNTSRILWLVPVCGVAACLIIMALATHLGMLAVLIAILSFVVRAILVAIIKKTISDKCHDVICGIENEYKIKQKEAEAKDSDEQRRYNSDLEAARQKRREENQPAREELIKQKKEYESRLKQIKTISDADMKKIPTLIKILESNRADNIKEALAVMNEQERQGKEAENKRRKEAEEAKRRHKAEEDARLATMPGTVHVRIGSINTYTKKLQTVRNTIYFNGAPYGMGDASGMTTFQLNPGAYNVFAQLEEAGYLFTSPTQSFTLPGNGHVYLKIMIRNARAGIYLCSSEADFRMD